MPIWDRADLWRLARMVLWAVLATMGMLLVFRIYRRATSAISSIKIGSRVGDVQMLLGRTEATMPTMSRADTLVMREQAKELSKSDPNRAAHLLRAWVESDVPRSPTQQATRR